MLFDSDIFACRCICHAILYQVWPHLQSVRAKCLIFACMVERAFSELARAAGMARFASFVLIRRFSPLPLAPAFAAYRLPLPRFVAALVLPIRSPRCRHRAAARFCPLPPMPRTTMTLPIHADAHRDMPRFVISLPRYYLPASLARTPATPTTHAGATTPAPATRPERASRLPAAPPAALLFKAPPRRSQRRYVCLLAATPYAATCSFFCPAPAYPAAMLATFEFAR